MRLKTLWQGNGVSIQVDEESGEAFVTNLIHPSVTVQVRLAGYMESEQKSGLIVSSPFRMEMGEDDREPAVLINRQ